MSSRVVSMLHFGHELNFLSCVPGIEETIERSLLYDGTPGQHLDHLGPPLADARPLRACWEPSAGEWFRPTDSHDFYATR